jgi:hypothetical protein
MSPSLSARLCDKWGLAQPVVSAGRRCSSYQPFVSGCAAGGLVGGEGSGVVAVIV